MAKTKTKIIDEVKHLRKVIKDASRRIEALQKKCKHLRVLYEEKADAWNRWDVSERCLDCGKFGGCSTRNRFDDDKPIRKINDCFNEQE